MSIAYGHKSIKSLKLKNIDTKKLGDQIWIQSKFQMGINHYITRWIYIVYINIIIFMVVSFRGGLAYYSFNKKKPTNKPVSYSSVLLEYVVKVASLITANVCYETFSGSFVMILYTCTT